MAEAISADLTDQLDPVDGLTISSASAPRVHRAPEPPEPPAAGLESVRRAVGTATTTGRGELPAWQRRYVFALLGLDTVALLLAGLIGQFARFETLGGTYNGIAYHVIFLAAAPVWLLTLAAARTYEPRFLGVGSEEFQRVGNAAARFTALVAMVVYLFKWDIARGLVIGVLPSSVALTMLLRHIARRVLHRLRRDGKAVHRVLVVGDPASRDVLERRLARAPHCGLRIVGTCPLRTDPAGALSVHHIPRMVASLQADTVAVTYSPHLASEVLRQVAWSLEGTGVDLLVAPALTDIAGPRVSIRPISGLPLLQIAEPEFTGFRRIVKRALDISLSGLAVVGASPLFLLVALAVRLSGPGPVLFRQIRIGKDGKQFVIFKFRSMYVDAERRLESLRNLNDHGDGVLFKMRDDPRITRLGRLLRRYSLDELPQLFNVLIGQMSVVGPRPPLPEEVAKYEPDAHRRLLVRPGLTGLWQVSGRSDLSWEETVRLDLYYVENWSVALDGEIIWKTAGAVLRGSGAR